MNVLFVAYQYPPCNASASKRLGGLAKYLPRHGWNPIILTREWTTTNCDYDPMFLVDLPNLLTLKADEKQEMGLVYIIKRKLFSAADPTYCPRDWLNNAFSLAENLIELKKVDAIFCSCPPLGALHIGSKLSEKYSLPWIADFRDIIEQSYTTNRYLLPWTRMRERLLLENVSRIITVSDGLREVLAKRHSKVIDVIPQGFDQQESLLNTEARNASLTITYTGSLQPGHRDPYLILEVINDLITSNLISQDRITVNFYIKNKTNDSDKLKNLIGKYEFLRIYDCVPRQEALKAQRNSDVLLLLTHPTEKGIITGKIFEYLGSQRFILAIPSDNDCVEKLLKSTGVGACCSGKDETRKMILELYNEWSRVGSLKVVQSSSIYEYSFDSGAKRLSELLAAVVSESVP